MNYFEREKAFYEGKLAAFKEAYVMMRDGMTVSHENNLALSGLKGSISGVEDVLENIEKQLEQYAKVS